MEDTDEVMVEELGFEVSENDQCLYVHPKTRMRVGAHVDDLASKEAHRRVLEALFPRSLESNRGVSLNRINLLAI